MTPEWPHGHVDFFRRLFFLLHLLSCSSLPRVFWSYNTIGLVNQSSPHVFKQFSSFLSLFFCVRTVSGWFFPLFLLHLFYLNITKMLRTSCGADIRFPCCYYTDFFVPADIETHHHRQRFSLSSSSLYLYPTALHQPRWAILALCDVPRLPTAQQFIRPISFTCVDWQLSFFLAITMLTALIQIFPLYFASFSSSIQPCSPIRLCHRSSHRNSGMRIRLQILVSFLKLSVCYWDPKESVGLQRCSLICAIYIDICAFCSSGRVMPSQDGSLRWL